MNKETRIFIWGLLLVAVCGWSLTSCVHSIVNEEWKATILEFITLICSFIGTGLGFDKILKTTK